MNVFIMDKTDSPAFWISYPVVLMYHFTTITYLHKAYNTDSFISHIKDHVNMVKATTWSLFMLQLHFLILFHLTILQEVERECLNQFNVCLINLLNIWFCSAHCYNGKGTMAKLHWKTWGLFAFVITVSLQK